VRRRGVEGVEVVGRRFDLGALGDAESEPQEDVLDLAADLGDQVQVARGTRRSAGQRDVDAVRAEAHVELGRRKRRGTLLDQCLKGLARRVRRRADRRALLGWQLRDAAQQLRQLGLAPEVGDPDLLERHALPRRGDRRLPRGRKLSDPVEGAHAGAILVAS